MKKLLTLCFSLTIIFTIKAQTAKQTLDYIQANINNYISDSDFSTTCYETYFSTVTGIYSATNKPSTEAKIDLKNIKAVDYRVAPKSIKITITGDCFERLVLFPKDGEVKKSSLQISLISDTPIENVQRIVKAIKHLAVLNGAELVKEDLFK